MAGSDRPTTQWRAAAAWGTEIVVWTLVLWGVWLVSLSAVDVPDLLVGGLTALACGLCAALVRRAIGQRWHPTWSLAGPAILLPVAIVVDAVAVVLSPWRSRTRRGEVRTVDIGGAGHSARQAARRAVITTVVTASPAAVVLDADDEQGVLVVHTLPSPGPSLQDRYARR